MKTLKKEMMTELNATSVKFGEVSIKLELKDSTFRLKADVIDDGDFDPDDFEIVVTGVTIEIRKGTSEKA